MPSACVVRTPGGVYNDLKRWTAKGQSLPYYGNRERRDSVSFKGSPVPSDQAKIFYAILIH